MRVSFAFGNLEIADIFSARDHEKLGSVCVIVDPAPLRMLDDDRARSLLATSDILVTGWGCPPIGAQVLASAPTLKLIAHAAGSVRGLIGPEVFQRGIEVTNAADANALPVAEFTLAAILMTNKQVLAFAARYRRERRALELYVDGTAVAGNYRKVIGLVGASRIGRRVIELLKPYDFEVLLHDPFVTVPEARELGVKLCELDHLLARSDVVSLHAPSLPATRQMIDARRLALIKDGAVFINTARGALVEHEALVRELQSGRISAVLDVTEPETLPPDSPLYELDNVVLTPHIAGAIGNERLRFGKLVVGEIERFLNGEKLLHAIDPDTLSRQA